MLRLVITLWKIVGKPEKLSAKSHLLRNFLAIRLPHFFHLWRTHSNVLAECWGLGPSAPQAPAT